MTQFLDQGIYRFLFDRSLDGVLLTRIDGTILDANPTACALLGMTKDEICAAGRHGLLAQSPELDRIAEERARTGSVSAEATFVRKDGTTFPGEFTSLTIPGTGDVSMAFVIFRDISARTRGEEDLRQSEARLVRAQALAHVGNWEIDLAARTMWASEEAFRIYGLEGSSPVIDLHYAQDFVLREDRPRLDAALRDLIAGVAPYDLEFQIARRGDDDVRTLHSVAELICDPAGTPVGVAGAVQDVTELRLVEERLRVTQSSVDHAIDLIIWTDPAANIVWINDATCAGLGYTREELLNLTLFDIDPGLESEGWDEVWRRMKHEGGFTFERELRTKGGEALDAEVSVNHIEYGGQEFNCAFLRDITERKQMQERAGWLDRILDDSLDEVYVFDSETLRFVQVNRGARRNLGYTMEELTEMTPLDLKPAFTAESFADLVAPLRSGAEQRLVFCTEHRRKDGSLYPVEVHLQLTEQGPRPMFLAIILDITARRVAEEALIASEEQLRQSQKMEAIGQLAGGIAHDFNNLLTAILGYSEMLLAGSLADKPAYRLDLEEIKRAAERAGALTRQILAFSRRQALRPRVVSLNDVLTGMEPLLRRSLGEDVELECRLQPDLGQAELDVHQFEQVLMNLAVNARDAMPVGGRLTFETANIEVDETFVARRPDFAPGGYVTISVTDTGLGMDEETLSHIYEPFFTTKEAGRGTGLGLSTAYGIVRQSGGQITVESKLGQGSRFTVYLPRVVSAEAAASEVHPAPAAAEGGETVLVVEDEDAVRGLVARVLRGVGHKVVEAASGVEALEMLRRMESPPDLLLTDLVLPGGMKGHELAEILRPSLPGLPVLLMSGYARDTVLHGGWLEEGVDFLQKPFTSEALVAKVREVLDKGRRAAASRGGVR